jgi:hypothetical protein
MSRNYELPGFKEYLGGALLGSAPLILMAIIFSFIDIKLLETEIAVITFVLAILGATLGGFLVAEKVNLVDYKRNVSVGGMTGLFSFLFNIVYFIIMLRIIAGDVLILVGFIIGGCLGGALSCRSKRVKK